MGAEFLHLMIEVPDTAEETARVNARAAVLRCSLETIRMILDGCAGSDVYSDCDGSDVYSEVADYTRVAELVDAAITMLFMADRRLDCTVEVVDERLFVCTGGMSWGDDPTEAYTRLTVLTYFNTASWTKSALELLAT